MFYQRRAALVWLFLLLILLVSAERRVAELDFNWSPDVRWENNDKPDGDEIRDRLVFVDDVALPFILAVDPICSDDIALRAIGPRQLFLGSRSEPRAPPRSHLLRSARDRSPRPSARPIPVKTGASSGRRLDRGAAFHVARQDVQCTSKGGVQ